MIDEWNTKAKLKAQRPQNEEENIFVPRLFIYKTIQILNAYDFPMHYCGCACYDGFLSLTKSASVASARLHIFLKRRLPWNT